MICRCIVVYTHCVIQYLAAVEKQQNRVEPWDSDMELLLAMDLGLLAPQLMALVLHSNSFIYYFNQIRTFYKWIQYNFWRHATRKTLKVLIFIHLSTKDTALTPLGPPLIGTFSPANPFVVSAILFQDSQTTECVSHLQKTSSTMTVCSLNIFANQFCQM